ncbi:MAG TPA: CRTAC1 family protein [Rhodothermales bacterium]
MLHRLPRRKRLTLLTSVGAVVFLTGAGVLVWASRSDDVYQPGERVEGLTNDLGRDLPADHPIVTFTDVTAEAGIDFVHFPGRRTSQLPEDMGSGAAWADFDGDGWIDLALANFAAPLGAPLEDSPAHLALYRNKGDGTFEDVSERAGIAVRARGLGVSWGDYDADRDPDLFLSTYGHNYLFENRGDGSLADVSEESGIAGFEGFWCGGAWADFDRDGDLDLYVPGYVVYTSLPEGMTSLQYESEVPASINPSSFEPQRNLLFRNRGNGTFEEVAQALGVDNPLGRSLSATWVDFNEDGWLDLYVANDVSDNVLYQNHGGGQFTEISHAALVADFRGAMGVAVADWDGDLDQDLFVSHWIAQENALYNNMLSQAREIGVSGSTAYQFSDVADRYGLGQISLDFVGWGTAFLDFDNDGRPDLYVANGSTFQQPDEPSLLTPMRDQLFWNRSNAEGFYEVSHVSGDWFAEERVGRGMAIADYDNDGDVDLLVMNHGDRPALLRNDGGNRVSWLQVALDGGNAARALPGTRIRVVTGDRIQARHVGAQASYLSGNSEIEHFGLGDAAQVDSLIVRWNDGRETVISDVPARRRVTVYRDGASLVAANQ